MVTLLMPSWSSLAIEQLSGLGHTVVCGVLARLHMCLLPHTVQLWQMVTVHADLGDPGVGG
jgi:hypothetical protein